MILTIFIHLIESRNLGDILAINKKQVNEYTAKTIATIESITSMSAGITKYFS